MDTILTSIAATHHNTEAQVNAAQSWARHGFRAVSINGYTEEVDRSQYKGVDFVSTADTTNGVLRRPYVMLSAMIDHARSENLERAFIVNSDIEIADPDGRLQHYLSLSETGLVFANRHDHNGDGANPTRYDFGFDAFIIHRKFYDLIPRSMFCMGQTWWDYWIPYRFIRSGVPVHLVKEPLFLHHRHPVQYNAKEWAHMTDHFTWIEGLPKTRNPQAVTNEVYRTIRRHAL